MDKLQECARNFAALLTKEYYIIIGRKGKKIAIRLDFTKWDFHHLAGLGKLKDLHIARQNRATVFDDIIAGKISCQTLAKSEFFPQIADRLEPLARIEQLLDANQLIFRYSKKRNHFSLIEADFLLSINNDNKEIYIFIAENQLKKYFCRSFFPKDKKDYTYGQARYTMLYKEKIDLATGQTVIQYNKLVNYAD